MPPESILSARKNLFLSREVSVVFTLVESRVSVIFVSYGREITVFRVVGVGFSYSSSTLKKQKII